ncbi:GNAT family N-acetyltransferase [Rothia halotolerans]|uniref:GNAT family N-acetyltransferase n=1 Tax=Rothia halotolerans TaxID=405770 RepID=UPI00101DC407|nr:GNAT family N-acetyltransferase [Rothia halotolerans]
MALIPFEHRDHLDGDRARPEYVRAHRRIHAAFYLDPGTPETIDWHARADQENGLVLRGFAEASALPHAAGEELPVATIGCYPSTLQVGTRPVPTWMVTAVGVAPTHRRRGLLRAMMGPELAEAQERGHALAALTASEATIYGRFGFGVSSRVATHRLDLTRRPRILPAVSAAARCPEASVHELPAADLMPYAAELAEALARGRAGQPLRTRSVSEGRLGAVDPEGNSLDPVRTRLGYLYLGPEGPEGYAAIQRRPGGEEGPSVMEVKDFQAGTDRARIGLWEHLLSLDLVDRIEFEDAPGRELADLLTDPRAVTLLRDEDRLWTRILDVPRVLESREYPADGRLALLVDDPAGLITGAYELEVSGGRAAVRPAPSNPGPGEGAVEAQDDAAWAPGVPRARLSADLLATAVFRGCATQARFGAVGGRGAGLAARLFAVGREPYCDFMF